MKRVLLIEDEKSLRLLIKMNLELEGYEVDQAQNGKEAIRMFESAYYDIAVLDLMLPQVSGIKVLEAIRVKNSTLPIIITSAKDTSSDRINGLKHGADDYLTKPFEIEELILRMQKLLDRAQVQSPEDVDTYTFGHNSIDFKKQTASNGDEDFDLSVKECLIMKYLISKKNEVVSRQDILKNVWGYDVFPTTRTVDNFISILRKYFEDDIKSPQHIKSIRGVGYKFMD